MLFYMSTPLRMHYRIHVTKNNELFCHMTRPSKPSRYINYGETDCEKGTLNRTKKKKQRTKTVNPQKWK